MKSLTRAALLLVLLTAYAAATVRPVLVAGSGRGFDALAPDSRFVERAIGERRFRDALPVALDLERAYPDEPLISYWLAAVYHGLDEPHEENDAWDQFIYLSKAGDDVCLGLKQQIIPQRANALYHDCAAYDTRQPDHHDTLIELNVD